MRNILLAFAALTAAVSWSTAGSSIELSLKTRDLFDSPKALNIGRQEQPENIPKRDPRLGPVFDKARVSAAVLNSGEDKLIGKTLLPDLLDRLLTVLKLKLGQKDWYVGAAADPANNGFFLTFMSLDKARVVVEQISYTRLKGNGQVVELDENTKYRVRMRANIFNPVRGSVVYVEPAEGTQGASYQFKTGELLDLVKTNSYVFTAKGKEFWLLYGTDIDSANKKFAQTRSLGFVHEAGMNTKVWTLPEVQLEEEKAKAVALGETILKLLRKTGGELLIYE